MGQDPGYQERHQRELEGFLGIFWEWRRGFVFRFESLGLGGDSEGLGTTLVLHAQREPVTSNNNR